MKYESNQFLKSKTIKFVEYKKQSNYNVESNLIVRDHVKRESDGFVFDGDKANVVLKRVIRMIDNNIGEREVCI